MNSKKIIMVGMTVGLFLGSFIPTLWGASELSLQSVFFSALGGFLGVWIAYKLSQD
ncbi:MAG TPA: hypothetical protein VIK86_08395 [Candidatus Paceibacterota bacterium]